MLTNNKEIISSYLERKMPVCVREYTTEIKE